MVDKVVVLAGAGKGKVVEVEDGRAVDVVDGLNCVVVVKVLVGGCKVVRTVVVGVKGLAGVVVEKKLVVLVVVVVVLEGGVVVVDVVGVVVVVAVVVVVVGKMVVDVVIAVEDSLISSVADEAKLSDGLVVVADTSGILFVDSSDGFNENVISFIVEDDFSSDVSVATDCCATEFSDDISSVPIVKIVFEIAEVVSSDVIELPSITVSSPVTAVEILPVIYVTSLSTVTLFSEMVLSLAVTVLLATTVPSLLENVASTVCAMPSEDSTVRTDVTTSTAFVVSNAKLLASLPDVDTAASVTPVIDEVLSSVPMLSLFKVNPSEMSVIRTEVITSTAFVVSNAKLLASLSDVDTAASVIPVIDEVLSSVPMLSLFEVNPSETSVIRTEVITSTAFVVSNAKLLASLPDVDTAASVSVIRTEVRSHHVNSFCGFKCQAASFVT